MFFMVNNGAEAAVAHKKMAVKVSNFIIQTSYIHTFFRLSTIAVLECKIAVLLYFIAWELKKLFRTYKGLSSCFLLFCCTVTALVYF